MQGTDYYSLPKAWLNLAAGRSLYGTFDPPAYGPHFTWYLAHPLLALVLGWPLSRFAATDSYGVFTIASLAIMAVCAWILARQTPDLFLRGLIWLLLLGSFPGFLMLWVGNVQALLVLGLSLLLVGMLRLLREQPGSSAFVLAGLLVSLFTKPVVLLVLPLLLLLRETRRPAGQALAIYVPVSLLFLTVPLVNPEPVGLPRIAWLAVHPGFVHRTMDIYANALQLTPDMRDNSIHWFNLLAQSDYRLQHVDVYSLPLFLDGLLHTRTPNWLYALPTLTVLGLSVAVARINRPAIRREAALLLTMAAALDFFLAYPTVWEYQYTAVLPVAATLLLYRAPLLGQRLRVGCLLLAACAWLPSLYFLTGSPAPDASTLLLVRLDRVVPVTGLFLLLCFAVLRATRQVPFPEPPLQPA